MQQPVHLRRPHLPGEHNPALVLQAEQRAQSVQNRLADRITSFAGSMQFVYIHIVWFGCWIAFGVEKYPYGLLTMIADQQWRTVKDEKRQNEELLALSRQTLDLAREIHAATRSRTTAK